MEVIEVLQSPTWSSSLLTGLKDLYATGQMFDVELVENSGRSLWAHSCVLAAACPLMKNAFMQTASQSPRRIFYADISIERWKQLLDFIYLGQVSVVRTQIPSLCTTATNLGLAELQTSCKEMLEKVAKERREQSLISPNAKKKVMKVNSPGASTRKRNMLVRVPETDQVPISLEVAEGGGLELPPKVITPKKEEDESENIGGDTEGDRKEDDNEIAGADDDNEESDGEAPQKPGRKRKLKGTNDKHESLYRCNKCNKDLPYGTSLFRHELRHKMFPRGKKDKKKGAFSCTKCAKRFPTKNARNMHERNHNKQPKFDCKHCEQKFFFEFVRDKHIMREHADIDPDFLEKKFECPEEECRKKFPTPALLRSHKSRVHGIKEENHRPEKPVPCEICGKEVLWLNEHKKSVHPEEMGEKPENHSCPECGKVMKYASSLKRHMYIHQEGGAANCPHCDKQFNHPSSLWSHFPACPKIPPEEKILLKTSTKKYKRKPKNLRCEICTKTFTNLRNYRNHVDNHLGKFKHICQYCGKKFQNTNHYTDHMNRHYGIKKFQCPHCDKDFASKSDMNQHIRQHTGERPFSCPVCNRTFVHRSNCYAHARKAHNKELALRPDVLQAIKNQRKGQKHPNRDEEEVPAPEENAAIVVTTDGTQEATIETVVQEPQQDTVQIAELLLQHQEKGTGSSTLTQPQSIGQTYTIQTQDTAGNGTMNAVLVPQYMYSSNAVSGSGNIYTQVAPTEFVVQQAPQQNSSQQPTELKFCLYEG